MLGSGPWATGVPYYKADLRKLSTEELERVNGQRFSLGPSKVIATSVGQAAGAVGRGFQSRRSLAIKAEEASP